MGKQQQHELPTYPESGFEFFADREAMNRSRELGTHLGQAREVKAVLVGGSKFIEHRPKTAGNITRTILPLPTSVSLKRYAESVGDCPGLLVKIAQTTKFLRDQHNMEIRWYPDMIHHAILIGDPDQSTGWAQFESVLPYAEMIRRPALIVYRAKFKQLVLTINDTFERMWTDSAAVDEAVLIKLLAQAENRESETSSPIREDDDQIF